MQSPSSQSVPRTLLNLAGMLILLAGYFLLLRPRLDTTVSYKAEVGVLALLVVLIAGGLLFALVTLVVFAFAKNRARWARRLGGQMRLVASCLFLIAVIVGASQALVRTPAVLGPNGRPAPNGVASVEKVRLGGADQWLILRGADVDKPVLLFLSGGPGASEAARVLRFNSELERHFVVVIWEQRGCGKSYPSRYPAQDLTVAQYTADVVELSEMLRARFDEQKIYLVGHSWGTIIGAAAAQARPDLYHAYVGTAQMVDLRETDQIIYDLVLDHSRTAGDTAFVRTLEAQGQPPYYGENPIGPYSRLFGREYQLFEVPNIKDKSYREDGDIIELMLKQPEYGWLDRVYYLLGLMNTFNTVYPQLQELDLRQSATHFDLPVYLMLGRHDMNNPYQIPEEYFDLLDAPTKQLYFFEDSGHGLIWEQAPLFHEIMVDTVLAETYQP